MIYRSLFLGIALLLAIDILAQTDAKNQKIDPGQHKIISTDRSDGRYVSTRGLVQYMLRNAKPELAFNPNFTSEEFRKWQYKVRDKIKELMQFPNVPPQPQPKLITSLKRDGYTLEKWESYPQPGSVVPFLMLVPDGISAKKPAPAVLCFSGSQGSKETLAGEENIAPVLTPRVPDKNMMAQYYVKEGMVAIAVDHPGIGESSDLERYKSTLSYDWGTFSRYLLDMGWSYLGLSAFQGQSILSWMQSRDFIDPNHIAVSGHSLGTMPAVVLAILNPKICAVVYNDHICSLIERAIVMSKPTKEGLRPSALGGLSNFPPETWKWFDYTDLLASLAPRPLIITEGGPTANLEMIQKAYQIMDNKDNFVVYYYPKYSNPETRHDNMKIPEGIDLEEWFRFINVDAPNHFFKSNLAVPWLTNILLK